MHLLRTKTLTGDQALQIGRLWDAEFPASLSGRFPALLDGVDQYGHLLLVDTAGTVQGWAAWFDKEGETRFSVIIPQTGQGRGYGKRLIDALKADLDECYGWVVDGSGYTRADGSPYPSPLAFYEKQGFEVLTGQRLETEILSTVKIRWRRNPSARP